MNEEQKSEWYNPQNVQRKLRNKTGYANVKARSPLKWMYIYCWVKHIFPK